MPATVLDQNPVLRELLATRRTRTPSGESVPLGSCIDAGTADALYRHIRKQKPRPATLARYRPDDYLRLIA